MTSDDFKKLLDKSLNPIKKDLGELKNSHDKFKKSVDELKYTVEEKVLPSVAYIETNIKAYKDSYQINNSNAKKLEKGVETLEANADIFPPPEHVLAEVS